ncbi:hypothetical protein [Halarsenatibacter silvermanii]|uniref:DUF4351 domain-containing protein n=1 Tax=Halarsenatibacter silvermanii TaxID=321763 RepID=A0A1G9TS79_9FIRM|nr:hypothetical protein [Halarsenatibacter silvermanii]SDM50294.1 hypothetical protein SAMN04488692_1458 [Halarsenatibacter silvermanii]
MSFFDDFKKEGMEKGRRKTLINTIVIQAPQLFAIEDTESLEAKLKDADIENLEEIRDNLLNYESKADIYDQL